MKKLHELKSWPEYFEAVADGRKTFEVRKDDRGFEVGDHLRCAFGPPWKGDYVLPNGPRGRRSTTYHACKAVEKAAGIDEKGVCRHIFRKTGPSHAVQDGESLEAVSEMLGDDYKTTKKHYARFKPEHLRSTVNRGWLTPPTS